MLILSRRQHQTIKLTLTKPLAAGTTITVLVSEIRPETVRIGVDAPLDVKIVRSELKPEGELR